MNCRQIDTFLTPRWGVLEVNISKYLEASSFNKNYIGNAVLLSDYTNILVEPGQSEDGEGGGGGRKGDRPMPIESFATAWMVMQDINYIIDDVNCRLGSPVIIKKYGVMVCSGVAKYHKIKLTGLIATIILILLISSLDNLWLFLLFLFILLIKM